MKFASKVIHGRKHGRAIGYPTANLQINDVVRKVLNKEGVYAVKVTTKVGDCVGALFYGKRSLFKDEKPVCEILLLNFIGDLYGQEISIEIIKYLRPVEAVKDETELKRLIEKDIERTNQLFNQ